MAAKSKKAKSQSAKQQKSQEALQVTWVLKGHLKNAQIAYIRVGVGLAKVRDEKLYEALKHPDMEDYAEKRLNLGRASLYRYLQVHDWIAQYHKEWLLPKPKGFIPDLADVADLIWIEKELAKEKYMNPVTKSKLENMREKALDGSLRKKELESLRQRGNRGEDSLRAFLKKLRAVRKDGAKIKEMPPEVLEKMDSAIEILENTIATQNVAMLFDQGKAPGRITA